MNFEADIQAALSQLQAGKEFSEIRKHLTAKGFNEDEIRQILRATDNVFLDSVRVKDKPQFFSMNKTAIAYGLFILGAGISISSFVFADTMGGYVIYHGPIIAGMTMIAMEKRKKLESKRKSLGSPYDKWRS